MCIVRELRVKDDTPTGHEMDAFLRARRNEGNEQTTDTRLYPIMGPQWNTGIKKPTDGVPE